MLEDLLIDIEYDVVISDWIKRSKLVGRISNDGMLGLLVPHRIAVDEINAKELLPYEVTEKQLRSILSKTNIAPYPHS